MKCDAELEDLSETKKISKKRKKKSKDGGMVILRLYFDDSSNKLKPLLIFDLNKVLVWRRTKTNFFVIRPHAIEVIYCYFVTICTRVSFLKFAMLFNQIHAAFDCAATLSTTVCDRNVEALHFSCLDINDGLQRKEDSERRIHLK